MNGHLHISGTSHQRHSLSRTGVVWLRTLLLPLLIAVVWGWLSAGSTVAQDRVDSLKAVYLYNFGNYVEWPARAFPTASESDPFVVGIVGKQHPVGPLLDRIGEKKKVGSRKITTRFITDAKDDKNVQVLFIPADTSPALVESLLKSYQSKPVLIVGETEGFARSEQGGMVNFFLQETHIKFEINPKTIQTAGLKASSKLMQLGVVISE